MNENNIAATIDPNVLPRLTIEEFRALSPEQKRIEIARDALAQLAAGRFVAEQNTYFSLFSNNHLYSERRELTEPFQGQELRDVIAQFETCHVCAMGACFASAVRLDDNLKLRVDEGYYARHAQGATASDFNGKLAEFFTDRQLELIEAAFERRAHLAYHYNIEDQWNEGQECWRNEEELEEKDEDGEDLYLRGNLDDVQALKAAIDFGRAYEDETERMEAILTSVANHPKGLFVP